MSGALQLSGVVEMWRGGRHLEAECRLQQLLEASPDDTQAVRFLAEIYAATGRNGQSIELWRRLSRLLPADAGVMRQLAQALMAERQFPEAVASLRSAIALDPANPRAYNNLGLTLLRRGDPTNAAGSLMEAVRLDPRYALAHMHLGGARESLQQPDAARASYECALQIDPHLSHARARLSELLRAIDPVVARGERDRALESHAINLMTVRRHDAALEVWAQLLREGSQLDYLAGNRFHCQLQCCDWTGYAELTAQLEGDVRQGRRVDRPFSFFVYSGSPVAQLECARIFAPDGHARPSPQAAPTEDHPDTQGAPDQCARIRLAYLSADFHEHATAYLIAGLLECHDRSRFEVTALSYGPQEWSDMRGRIEKAAERFIDVSQQTDDEVVALMRELRVDLAVDLKGFTGGARPGIFARRAAPVQINYLGFPGTLGADYFDCIIADRHVIPEPDRVHYAEEVVYLPQCYQPNDRRRSLPLEAPSRSELGLPAQGRVFCCFNNLYKITPSVYGVWMDLLRRVPHSVLWLLEGTPPAMANLRKEAASQGVALERVVFAPHIALSQHLARYRHADLFLDTSPCNAHTTASDALWMGVPVLTITGSTFAGRVATSLLHAVELPQLCMKSLDEYAAEALRLASSPDDLRKLKAHLEDGRLRFPLFDTAACCRDIESAYQRLWEEHRGGRRSRPLSEGASDYE